MRAEELIMQVWTQRRELLAAGKQPGRIVISRRDYLTIQEYRSGLGFLPDGVDDYLSRYSLFEIPFFLHEKGQCTVTAESDTSEPKSQ